MHKKSQYDKIISMVDQETVEQPTIESSEIIEQPKEGPKKKKGSTWKYVLNIIIVLVISAVAVFLAVRKDFHTIVHYIITSDYRFILIIVGLMMTYVIVKGFMWFCFARLFTRDYKYHQGVAVELIGTFYAAVTPGGQGGEVMQAYTYKKQGIPISSAVSALAMNSIVHQILLILFGVVSLIAKYDFIGKLPYANLGTYGDVTIRVPMWVLTIIGFGLNVGYIGIILAMAYWRGFHNFIMGPIISLLGKIKILKNPDKSRENLRTQIENFKIEIRRLFSNVPFTMLVSLCFIVSMTIKFSIPYFVGLAMGNESTCATFWDAIFLSNYHQMATGLIPVPGSAGVSEFVFNTLYSTSPALPTTSFFFVNATADQVGSAFNSIMNNPGSFTDFFKSAVKLVPGFSTASEVVQAAVDYKEAGTAFIDTSSDFQSMVQIYANTRASSSMASASLVMWRFSTFIMPLIVAGFTTAFYRASPKETVRDSEKMPGRHTLVDLQRETYSDRVALAETMIETSRLNRENIARRLKDLRKKDRHKKAKEKAAKEAEKENLADPNEFADVTIDDGDDSL